MPKLLTEITAQDFERSKVWKYYGTSDDNATVEASAKTDLVEDDDHIYLVATEFRLADGTIMRGFTSPADNSGLDYVQPVIFHDGGQLVQWSEDSRLQNIAHDLGRSAEDVYPIYWKSEVPVDKEIRSGNITL